MTIDKSRIISLSDKVCSIFLNANSTEMQMMTFVSHWQKSFKNQKMDKSVLSKLPFLKIIEYDLEDDDSDNDDDAYSSSISIDENPHEIKKNIKSPQKQETSPLIIVNIEQDDCCNFCKLGKQCTLIHILSKNDYCSEFEKSGHCSNFQCKLFHRPNIKLIQRLIDCFKSKQEFTDGLKLSQVITLHNELFPQFISHSPTLFGITSRCSSKFQCKSDSDATNSNDFVIEWKGIYTNPNLTKMHRISPQNQHYNPWQAQKSPQSIDSNPPFPRKKSPIIPEQSDMFKIYMKLEKKWTDNALIKELLQYFKKNSKIPLQDMYIPRRNRSGFVTFQHKTEAAKFMAMVNSPTRTFKCGGRTITVRKPTKQNVAHNGSIKLHIQNVGCCVSFPQFVSWCRENIDTPNIYNLQLVNNTVTEGAGYAILVIENEKDGQQFIKDLNIKEFRGEHLTFSPWVEPIEYKKSMGGYSNNNKARSIRRHSYSTSHNQSPLWKYASTSSRSRRRSTMTGMTAMTALTAMMGDVDIDFKQRKTMSRLKKRHSLRSDNSINSKSPSSQTSTTPPGLTPTRAPIETVTTSTDISANIGFKEWLSDIAKCGEYYDKFINAGFDSMDEMDPSLVTHDVLKEVGVCKIGHRVKILKAIDQFQSVVGINNT